MEYYNGTLCISKKELIISDENPTGIMSNDCYKKQVNRKKIKVVCRGGGENNYSLIEFESLPPKYKKMVKEQLKTDPEVEAQKQKILNHLEYDQEAIDFFKFHKVGYEENKKYLPDDIKVLYSNNAAVLNAIKKAWDEHVLESSKHRKRPLSGKFWSRSAEAIKTLPKKWNCDLPENPKRLKDKMADYIKFGYSAILSGKWGNQNTRIITQEIGDWLVAQWSSYIKIVTIEQLHARYNQHAEKLNNEAGKILWKKIKSSVAIRDYLFRPDIKEKWYASRYGELSYKEEYTRKHKTRLAGFRDSLWYSDGTKLNFFYQDENGNAKTANVYEVMDVYSECFLGYYISQTENFEAQFNAFKMAIQTSGHKPYELKFDNQGGHKMLENGNFLTNIANHAIRTAPYNGKSKTIEYAFYRFQADFLHKEWYFTGQNIKTKKKESQARMEFILSNLKKLPTLETIKKVYQEKRNAWNNAPHPKTGIPRIEMYRSSVNNKAQELDFLDMLTLFGITTKEPSTYRSSGILFTVKKQKYQYEVLDANGNPDTDFMRKNINRKFYIRYDMENMDIVSLYEKDASGMRFITFAQPYIEVQRNLQEQTTDDQKFIRQMEIVNKLQRINNAKQLNERLERYDLHPNQHGLNVPKLKGINMRKKPIDIGEIQKEVSNMTELDEKQKVTRKTAKRVEKQEERVNKDDQREFDKRRIEMMKELMN